MTTSIKYLHQKALVRNLLYGPCQYVCGCRSFSYSRGPNKSRTLTHITPSHVLYPYNTRAGIHTSTIVLADTSIDSTTTTSDISGILPTDPGYIPPAPAEWVDAPASAVYETLAQAGLDTWWPAGLIRSGVEFVHLNFDIPWWGAIVAVTLVFRCLVLPVWLKGQSYTIKMHNHFPEIRKIQEGMRDAELRGDEMKKMMLQQDMVNYYKSNDISIVKQFLPIMIQVPFFSGMFIGLRAMCNAPIEGLKNDGFLWLTDLTIADPYFILPLLCTASLYGTIILGSEGGNTLDSLGPIAKKLMFGLPIVAGVTTSFFPSALGIYWLSSNIFGMGQVSILMVPAIRRQVNKVRFFRLPEKLKHEKPKEKKKSFIRSVKDWKNDASRKSELNSLSGRTESKFVAAGHGPIQKTFAYDPTKPQPTNAVRKRRKYY